MKQLLLKYAPIIIGITALADRKFDLLIQIGLTKETIGLIELAGLILALFLPSLKDSFKRKANSIDWKTFEGLEDLKEPLKVKNVTKSETNNTDVFLSNSNQTFDNSDPFNTNIPKGTKI